MYKLELSVSKLFLRAEQFASKVCKNVGENLFSRYLLATNCFLSIVLSFAGDVLMQRYEMLSPKGNKSHWDPKRSCFMSISGLAVGIICHYWYIWLDKKFAGRSIKIIFKKIVIDQFLLSPILICTFFATFGALEGEDVPTIAREVIEKGYRVYLAEFIIWPPAQLFSFYFLPTRFRVLYEYGISLCFDIYISHVKNYISENEPAFIAL